MMRPRLRPCQQRSLPIETRPAASCRTRYRLLPLLALCVLGAPPALAWQATSAKPEATAAPSAPGKTETGKPDAGKPAAGKPGEPSADKKTGAAPAAATTVQIKRELTGEFTYRFVSGPESATAPTPLPAPAGTDNLIAIAVPPDIKLKETQLEILDNTRGNAARLPLTLGTITPLTESSFQFAQVVYVPVQAKGKAVVGAQVTLTDADKKFNRSWLLKPADNGVAQFANVPLGVPVTVAVSLGGNPPETQTKTLLRDHPAEGYRWPAIEVSWPNVQTVPMVQATPTVAPSVPGAPAKSDSAAARSESDSRAPAENSGGLLSGLAGTVVALLLLAGIGYGIYWAVITGRMKTLLGQIGIQTEPVVADGAGGPSPFAKPEKPPIVPITEGTADPFAGAVGATAGSASGAARPGTGPRLVATMGTYAGNIFPLNGQVLAIGRDASNTVALPQDTNASRRHAVIQASGGQVVVVDNGSSNGTFVNGVRIPAQTPQPLHPGDEVQVGMTRFRFEA